MLEPDASERAPTLAETIRRHVTARMVEARYCMPVAVTSYDGDKRKASCRILVKEAFLDEGDARQVESLPIVNGVPVVFPGSGKLEICFPIPVGTKGVMVFTDRSLDKWLTGDGSEVDPEIDHMHALADGILMPGLYPFGAVPQGTPTDHIALGEQAGNDWVALAQKVLTELQNIQSHFTAVESVLTGPPIPEPGNGSASALQAALAVAIGASPYPSPGSVAASQVKAK